MTLLTKTLKDRLQKRWLDKGLVYKLDKKIKISETFIEEVGSASAKNAELSATPRSQPFFECPA
jgi:hypothetical protein